MQIQRNVLENAKVSQEDINRLETAWNNYQALRNPVVSQVYISLALEFTTLAKARCSIC